VIHALEVLHDKVLYKFSFTLLYFGPYLYCNIFQKISFHSASALLAMQTAVLARGILFVCLSFRLSCRHIPMFYPDE